MGPHKFGCLLAGELQHSSQSLPKGRGCAVKTKTSMQRISIGDCLVGRLRWGCYQVGRRSHNKRAKAQLYVGEIKVVIADERVCMEAENLTAKFYVD